MNSDANIESNTNINNISSQNGASNETPFEISPLISEKCVHVPDSPVVSTSYNSNEKVSVGCCSKYGEAIKVCLPWRPAQKDKTKLPSNKSSFINYLSVAWITRLMWKAYRKGLSKEDIWEIQDEDSSAVTCDRLERFWREEQKGAEPLLWKSVWRSIRTRVLMTILISTVVNVFQFIGPSVFLKLILDYINDPLLDHGYGALLVILLLCVNVCRGAFFNFMIVISTHTAARMTGGLQAMIYRKILKLKSGGEKLSAQITNILTSDMERLFESVISSVFITASPMLFILTAVYSIYIIGPWALMGLGCYLLLYPVMGVIAHAQSRVRQRTVKKTDKRVGLMTEILNSIRLIKMYSWEDSFAVKIAAIRQDELRSHLVGGLFQAVASTTVPSISILATICTLLGYTLTGYPLKSSEAFTIFSMFNAMQFTAGVLPYTIRNIAEAKVSLTRIQKLMELPQHKKGLCGVVQSSTAIGIKNATFAWETHSIDVAARAQNGSAPDKAKDSPQKNSSSRSPQKTAKPGSDMEKTEALLADEEKRPDETRNEATKVGSRGRSQSRSGVDVETAEILHGLNLTVSKGSLVGVCGSIGAGKSSLISAICGDMHLQSGDLQINGRLAVVPQQAWIYNASLRENVLVGQDFDEVRFGEAVRACCLDDDIKKLPNGDLTEIGERGVNLSGGQKQRVNLARAVYCSRDIYLLDDPLSAVDAKVASQIFTNCIVGVLKGRTVILVTHGTQFLEKCDEVIMMSSGRICERGTHQALLDRKGPYHDLFMYSSHAKGDAAAAGDTDPGRKRLESLSSDGKFEFDGKLIKEETKEMGSVKMKVYLDFIKLCGGWCRFFMVLFVILLFTLSRLFNIVWMQQWLDAGDGNEAERRENETLFNVTLSDDQRKGDITRNPDLWLYQTVYALSFFILIIAGVFKGIGVTFSVLAGSSRLHNQMFGSVLRAPMSFFDSTPVGRIITRFSRDLDEVDVRIPFFLEFVLQGLFSIVGQIVLVTVIFPLFLAPLLVIAGLFVLIDFILNVGVRELKRVENTYKAPVIQHLGASINGLSLIRTFDRERDFVRRFGVLVDKHSAAQLVFRLSSRWFSFRMDLMATLITIAITTICVFTKGRFSTAVAGLALASISGVCGFIPFFMRMKSELISRISSVERILEYVNDIDSEAPRDVAEDGSDGWPSAGQIQLEEVTLRYRPNLPVALKGVSASVRPGEKVGIVGRTGAGKSSLISCLVRIVEAESGRVVIDSVDISRLGLRALRSAISVIPQDPILFQGTVRYNIDPFERHSDDEVWESLERAHLKRKVGLLPLKLQSEVEAAGENFSVGERQLICLARALLRKNKILVLDEATASVDLETDHLIQRTVKEAFQGCTVLTIAHRLNTISHYDRVLVMDKGSVREFDAPANLMKDESSLFRDMMKATGVTDLAQLQRDSSQ